jgi:hypothetical protein
MKWASTSAEQSLRVAEDAELEARERARAKPGRDLIRAERSGATKASTLKADQPTKRDWEEAFTFLMANLDVEVREAVTRVAEDLAREAVSVPRRKTYSTMAGAAGSASPIMQRTRHAQSSAPRNRSMSRGSASKAQPQDPASD